MSGLQLEEFYERWTEMTFEQRSLILRDAIQELAIDQGLPIPEISILDEVGRDTNGRPIDGEYFDNTIVIYAGAPADGGGVQFDDPMRSLDTAAHEMYHYTEEFQGYPYDEAASQVGAEMEGSRYMQEFEQQYLDYQEFGPEPSPLPY